MNNYEVDINNGRYPRKCLLCGELMKPQEVHQRVLDKCIKTKIHVHKWFIDTGNCYYPGCENSVPVGYLESMSAGEQFAYVATKRDIDRVKEEKIK